MTRTSAYMSTPHGEAEVVADRRNIEEFKEVSRTIERELSVRVLAEPLNFLLWAIVSCESLKLFCLLLVQSLAEWTQAQTCLLWEAANAHTEAAMTREAKLQAQVEAAQEIQHVNEAMVRQAQKEAAAL
jgi:hypothetical protein